MDELYAQFKAEAEKRGVHVHRAATAAEANDMVCVHNIVAACAVVGLSGREGEVLRRTFWPFMLYGTIVGIICTVLVMLNPGVF